MFDLKQLPPIHYFLHGHELNWDTKTRVLKVNYVATQAMCNPRGHIEGGMLCAMLDDAMGILAALNQAERPATTVNLHMDFYRPCQIGVVHCIASFRKEGRKILNLHSEAWQDEKMIASVDAAFLLL